MSNYASLKATINANIRENGNQEITGVVLNSVLNDLVNTMGAGYQFAGVASPSTNPGNPDERVFYLAFSSGTYTYFGNTILHDGELGVFKYDSSWTYQVIPVSAPIADNLTTNDPDMALSAAQGYYLGQVLGLSSQEVVDAYASNPTASELVLIPARIVAGTTYRIAWNGATPNSSVLSVSFGTTTQTLQTTPLNQTTLTAASGYVEVIASVNTTHVRLVSRSPIVSEVIVSHMEEATGVLDNLKNSLYNAFPTTDLFWLDHKGMRPNNGVVDTNTNAICSRIFLPVEKYAPDGFIRFLANTQNTYNFAISLYSSASESSHITRIGFVTSKEIDIRNYPNAAYFRLTLVYKDENNSQVLSAGFSDGFDLDQLFILYPSKLQDVGVNANTSVRVATRRSEVMHKCITTALRKGQGFCKFGNYWLVALSSGASFSSGSTATNYIYIYNENFSQIGSIAHNLGHFSCLSYNEEMDVFISSNGDAGEYPRLDILLDAATHVQAAINGQTSQYMYGASDVIHIPLHTSAKDLYGVSDAGVWCFGGNNRYVYISVRNRTQQTRRFYKGILGVGTANFADSGTTDVTAWGTFLSGKTNQQYNGTLKILDVYEGDNIASAQGLDYYNGKLVLSSSADNIDINVVNLDDNNYQIIGYHRISNLAADGSSIQTEPEDLTITEDGIFVNTAIGMFQVFLNL